MSTESLAIACLLSPLVGCFLALVLFRRAHAIASLVVVASGVVSLAASATLLLGESAHAGAITARWFAIGDTPIDFGVLLDGRTAIMGAVVALITLCIEVYSLAYMAHDKGRARFFAFLALFEWAMLAFVYSASLLQSFIFWELVGLASFLLIGFWYEKPSAVAAAKKAFIMTRIGDVGLFIGLILLFQATGTLDIPAINALFAPEGAPSTIAPGRIELIAALLFIGVVGKSAQFPLHTWLPDAMEGPTPVSALLHSATMVAAGVFLVTRFHDLFLDAPITLQWMLWIAVFTAILSSTMAMVAKDMKRILAFSSISQLGFMLMGLAAGSLFAGYFHLITHAFFKALLFCCAGAFIHHVGSNDIVAMGRAGAAKQMKLTTLATVIGAAALAGVPFLSGFFSKEQIIGSLPMAPKVGALFAALLTAYYSFRMVFLIVRPNPDSQAVEDEPAHAQHDPDHPHHGPAQPLPMLAPILLLAIGALGAGYLGSQIGHLLHIEHMHHPTISEMAPAVVIALLGIAFAWLDFGRRGARQTGLLARVPSIETLFRNRWYLDEFYNAVVVRAALWLASLCFGAETKGLDGGADAIAEGTVQGGEYVARSHTGRLQFYIGTALVVVAALALTLGLTRGGGAG
ncbi:MAG: NADH-quinone oxidoreductase subunit L [Phycisphaeraceae bacterium]|nr:NADH-quinone oxidoreductase subunit L [Phycisphaeraceae bacterium]